MKILLKFYSVEFFKFEVILKIFKHQSRYIFFEYQYLIFYNSSAILFIFLSLWFTPLLVMGLLRLSANRWIE